MTAPNTPSLPKEALGQLASEISGAFSVALFELETVRATTAEVDAEVRRLLEAAAPDEAGEGEASSFGAFLANATRAAEAAEAAAGSLADRDFQNALVSVTGALQDMKKCTFELATISSLTKITQSEADGVSHRVAAFTQSLDGRCRELRSSSAESFDLIAQIQQQSGLARDELAAIGREFRGVSDQAGRQTQRLAELEAAHRARMVAVRENADRLGQGVRRAVAELIGCLQFPDAFSQRAEHVRLALHRMEGTADAAERHAVARVLSAQLEAMARALEEVTGRATGSLRALVEALDQGAAIGGTEALDPSSAWMDANARANEAMLRSVAVTRQQLASALELLAGLTRQIDGARSSLEASSELNHELEISVHNASIVASRFGSSSSPLRVLAGGVKDVVGRTSGLIGRIATALTHIGETSEALERTSLKDELETLLGIQEAALGAASRQAGLIETVRGARQGLTTKASRLAGAATAGAHAFEAAGGHAATLAGMAERLRPAGPALDVSACDLGWLHASYTMEEERAVHREVLGLPLAEPDPADADADLDEFML